MSPQARRDKVISVLREVGLDRTVLYHYPHEFSGGQRQRIAIARGRWSRAF
ncbi:MAG: Oligopeptide transport system permease protein OppB (TC 3.A.1.5.1) [uncultured Paraburkholderia sp.]|nr:MAG: Oligopeptide transport system permease protein OppB (TC 3.A.1.5.1) [uncultured Paraburkholderia sp.]CAH2912755.1 MAG: Oligopeptide transport system permease protein OppB (TC 3.A.1.5.1) [uncultured Paraburkholderia sp.]